MQNYAALRNSVYSAYSGTCFLSATIKMSYHLQSRYVLLPPQVLLHVGPKGGQQVVTVHDDMHKWVDNAEQSPMASCKDSDILALVRL
jgi:hypothetical protein